MKLSMLVLQIQDFCAENGTEKSQFFVDREGKLRVLRYMEFVFLWRKGKLTELIIFEKLFSC